MDTIEQANGRFNVGAVVKSKDISLTPKGLANDDETLSGFVFIARHKV